MVKGITRQVILVKSPDPKLFEEAIFIVREEALQREGVTADQVIRQARQTADGYLKGHRRRRGAAGPAPFGAPWGPWLPAPCGACGCFWYRGFPLMPPGPKAPLVKGGRATKWRGNPCKRIP